MNLENMQQNLTRLAQIEGCTLTQKSNIPGMMYVEFGWVEGPLIENGISLEGRYPNAQSRYLTCLHELGHFHWGHTQGRPWVSDTVNYEELADRSYWEHYWGSNEEYFNNGVLKSEAQAWNYALDKCDIPSAEIEPETRRFMWDTCLGSYFNHARAVGFDTPGQRLYNGDRHYITFAYGRPSQYFSQTKRRIIEGDEENIDIQRTEQELLNALNNISVAYPTWNINTNTIPSTTPSSTDYIINYIADTTTTGR